MNFCQYKNNCSIKWRCLTNLSIYFEEKNAFVSDVNVQSKLAWYKVLILHLKQNTEIEMALQVLSADRDLTRKVSYYLYTFDIQPRKKGRRMDKTVCMLHI